MQNVKLIDEWWLEPGEGDASMEAEHDEIWKDILDNVFDIDLSGKKVLDFGCNRGGFLKMLHDRFGLEKGVGVDLAQTSINVANSRIKSEPLKYIATTDLSVLNDTFDVVTSTAVIYLIQDIQNHAKQVFNILNEGGIYYVTHPDYTHSKGGSVLTREINKFAAVPCATNTLDDIANAFENAGFKVGVKRLKPCGYIAHSKNSTWYESIYDRIQHEYAERYALRLVKPRS